MFNQDDGFRHGIGVKLPRVPGLEKWMISSHPLDYPRAGLVEFEIGPTAFEPIGLDVARDVRVNKELAAPLFGECCSDNFLNHRVTFFNLSPHSSTLLY